MAESGLRCEGCSRVLGCCVEILHCGHYFCRECSYKKKELDVACLLCEYCEVEDCDILSSSEDNSIERTIPVKEGISVNFDSSLGADIALKEDPISKFNSKTGMSGDSNAESNQQHPANESTNLQHAIDVDDLQNALTVLIDDALVKANENSSQLNSDIQMLGDIETRHKAFEESVSRQIDEEFHRLFVALEARKFELFAEFREASAAFKAIMEKAARNLQEKKKDLEARARFARELKESPDLTIYCNLSQLIADLMVNIKNEHMIESLKTSPNIRFKINGERIIALLGTIGSISYDVANNQVTSGDSLLPNGSESNLLNVDQKHDHGTTNIMEASCSMDCQSDLVAMVKNEYNMEPDYLPCLESVNSINQTTSMPSFNTATLSHMLPVPDVIVEEIIEDDEDCNGEFVFLSHIVNPCNFYVHRISQNKQLIMFERSLSTQCLMNRKCCPHDILELGEVIAFRSVKRALWCRGRITELIPLESKYTQKPCGPTRYLIEDISRITLFLLDYGSSEIFIVKKFAGTCLTKGDPAFIYQTKVNDLCPYFTKMSLFENEMLRLMDPLALHCSMDIVPRTSDGSWSKDVRNQIFKMTNNKSVQMKVLREENKTLIVDLKKPIGSKTSSDMPISLRDALVFLELAKFPSQVPGLHENEVVAHYKDPELPKNMTDVVVIVCHINDPSDFYINMVGGSKYITAVKKIQDVYNEETDDLKIAYPVIGQACVSKYEDDDQWYRAEIIGLPSPQDVDISYVDFGNVSRVNVADLRLLKEEFLTLPRKAICCRLAYIQPYSDAAQWSSEACKLFEEMVSYKHLRCNSIGMFFENKLSIELFDVNPATVMSINSILVRNKVADFIPCVPGSTDPHLPLKEVWDTVLDQPLDSIEKCIDTISLSERKELDVYISHVVSPNKIFVQWLSTDNILKSLELSLFEKYENSKPESTEWQVDMHVAIQLSNDKIWRRGKINRISEDLVEVFCYDFGMKELTNVTNVRTLDDSLKIYGTMCLECTLMDIQPAGGCKNWTATACDFLYFYLNGAEAKIIIEENAALWPLPVRILRKNEAGQLIDMSDFLVKKGLALRDRRCNKHDSLMEVNKTARTSIGACESVTSASAEPSCAKSNEESNTVEENFTVSDEIAMDVNIEEPYLPPLIPNETTFMAKVSHIAEDGTIYVIQDCLDKDLGILMLDIQNSFKCLGLMAPYDWKKGEGCLIKGSDTMSYRGRVLEILGGDLIKVQYEDFGFTEKIPKCHLYPSIFNQRVPRFCIPCQLVDVLPVGYHWQTDAILFLKELLLERLVDVHLVEPPNVHRDFASIYLYCGNASVSAILELYAYCIPKDYERKTKIEAQSCFKKSHEKKWDIELQELLFSEWDIPILCKYLPLPLPSSTEVFKVKVTHIETPDRMFICFENREEINNDNPESNGDTVTAKLKGMNAKSNILPHLTDFKTEMPCLATYNDGMLHRAKLVSVKRYDPVAFIVEFVDYGSTAVLETCSLFQLHPCLIQYPAKAIKVKLAGFRPPKEDNQKERLPYKPEWSFKAMFEMIELVQGRTLFAKCLPNAAENIVGLFDEKLQPVYIPLLNMGLADPE
ncbi:RING finger protein 17 [Mantella aurantiaca]